MTWKNFKLGEICTATQGIQIPKNKQILEPKKGYRRYLYISDFKRTDKLKFVEDIYPKKLVTDEDIVVSNTGSQGEVYRGINGVLSNNLFKVTINNELVDKNFLYLFLQSPLFIEFQNARTLGTTQPHMGHKNFLATPLRLPTLAEQKRIVAILDQAFADIEKTRATAETNLKNARELFDSYLQQVFNQHGEGWIDKPLDEICDFSSGGTPSKKNDRFWDGDIPWISGRDMKTTQLFDSFLHISEVAIEESAARTSPVGTILCLVRGMGLAHGAQIAELMVPCAFNQDIKGIHPKPEIVSRYLVFALRHRIDSSSYVLSSAAHGTRKINMEQLKELIIPVPSKHQQKKIVNNLNMLINDINALKSVYLKKLNKLDELKKSILQKAFSGEPTTSKVDAA